MSAEKTSDEGYKPLQSSASSPPQRKSQEFLGLPKPSGRRGGKGIVSKADKAAAAAAAAASQQAAEEEARRKEALLQGQIDGVGRQGSAGSGGSSDDEPEPEPEPTAEAKEEEEEGPKETLDEKVVKREAARKAHVKKLFAKIDTKGKGKIETHRLHEAFLELGMRFDKFEVNKMIAQFDADQSGTIDLEEFGSMIYELNRKRFRKVFNDFDVDGSGELDEEEVRQAFELLDFVFTDEQMKAMMLEFDDSGDGLIQFPEFCEMLDSTLIGEDQKEEEIIVDETPWGDKFGVATPVEPIWMEEEQCWGWICTAEHEINIDEDPDTRVYGQGIPMARATSYLRTDGHAYRGDAGGLYMPRGWITKGVPKRTIHNNLPETDSWYSAGGHLSGTGVPERLHVKFSSKTLRGGKNRVLVMPDASEHIHSFGDTESWVVAGRRDEGEEEDEKGEEEEEEEEEGGGGGGQEGEEGEGEGGGRKVRTKSVHFGRAGSDERVDMLVLLERGATEGQVGEGDAHQSGEGRDTGPSPNENGAPGGVCDGEAGDVAGDRGGGGADGAVAPSSAAAAGHSNGDGGSYSTSRDLKGGQRASNSRAPILGDGDAGAKDGASEGGRAEDGEVNSSKTSGAGNGAVTPGTGATGTLNGAGTPGVGTATPGSSRRSMSGKKSASQQDKAQKKDYKISKMEGRLEDLARKQANDGVTLMEQREMALLQRHIKKAADEAEEKRREEERKAEEEAAWQPHGFVAWKFKIMKLSDTGMGMRVGIVHTSVSAGSDWNDYAMCNNKSYWWNSFSGNLFVGDIKVPESGSIYSLDICKDMWAPSRNDPTMGVPFSKGDVITIQLDIAAGELTFMRNGVLLPHRVCGVWGEVVAAVQLSAAGDEVIFLETVEEKEKRVNGRLEEERRIAAEAKKKRDAARRAALSQLGLL